METLRRKMDCVLIRANSMVTAKKEAMDQIVIMFIIIAVAAGIIGLLYNFATGSLMTTFQTKMSDLVTKWFDHT